MAAVVFEDDEEEQFNITSVFITANPNIVVNDAGQLADFKELMNDIWRNDVFGDAKATGEIFGEPPLVKRIKRSAYAAEVGSHFHRGHVHMVVEIQHTIPRYSHLRLKWRLRNYLNREHSEAIGGHSWYVNVRLNNTSQINYTNKEARKATIEKALDDVEGNSTLEHELDRLSGRMSGLEL